MFGNKTIVKYHVYNEVIKKNKPIYMTEELQSFIPRVGEWVWLDKTKQEYLVNKVTHYPESDSSPNPYIIVKLLENP